jgi:hypothetical protein
MRLRECLISFVGEIASPALVPEGTDAPKAADVKGWLNLLADHLAAGPSESKLRSYVKSMGEETWNYVNWLTHAKNAGHWDAEIGTAITSHLLATVTATRCVRTTPTNTRAAPNATPMPSLTANAKAAGG